jgi:acetyl-CoA synthase
MGQRAIIWVRISKEAFQKGFRIKHFAEILIAKIHEDFNTIVDRVQVTIHTDDKENARLLEEARETYRQRDDKIGTMIDEDVSEFYSCTLCQSYAPDHVCIVTPQRLGLCGAYTWLDCKASHQINQHGPNEPVKKGETLDAVKGQWRQINDYVELKSNGNIKSFNLYSLMEDPMTSCGCFECIVAMMPEANGVIVVDRDYLGVTPIGIKFSELAGMVGGGAQTPGFAGIGKLYLSSPKFISAEGGQQRIVWMPKELKQEVEERFKAQLDKSGSADLFNKIATEDDATDVESLLAYLQQVNHPALSMPPLF